MSGFCRRHIGAESLAEPNYDKDLHRNSLRSHFRICYRCEDVQSDVKDQACQCCREGLEDRPDAETDKKEDNSQPLCQHIGHLVIGELNAKAGRS